MPAKIEREHTRLCAPCSLASAPASGAKYFGTLRNVTAKSDSGRPLQQMPHLLPAKCERPKSWVAHQVQSHSVTSPLRRNSFMLIKATRKSDSVRWHSWIPPLLRKNYWRGLISLTKWERDRRGGGGGDRALQHERAQEWQVLHHQTGVGYVYASFYKKK